MKKQTKPVVKDKKIVVRDAIMQALTTLFGGATLLYYDKIGNGFARCSFRYLNKKIAHNMHLMIDKEGAIVHSQTSRETLPIKECR